MTNLVETTPIPQHPTFEAILILRTHALYGHDKWVLGVLLTFALAATGSAVVRPSLAPLPAQTHSTSLPVGSRGSTQYCIPTNGAPSTGLHSPHPIFFVRHSHHSHLSNNKRLTINLLLPRASAVAASR